MISLIVAKSQNNVIGVNNDLPWHLSGDLKRFKELTSGQTVVMGRNTYESIVSRLGHSLPNRLNVVVSRRDEPFEGAETIHHITDIKRFEDAWVIGGAQIYAAALPLADKLYVTDVKTSVDGDAFFPVIDMAVWREVSRESHKKDEKNNYDYDFVVYKRS